MSANESTMTAAVEALGNEFSSQDGAAPAPAPEATPAPEQAQTPAPVDGGATPEDSFTAIDPSTLDPALQELYKQMQGDYTRKTQDIAPFRQLGLDAQQAAEAAQLYQALNDESNLAQLHQNLTNYLEQNGLLPGEQPQTPAGDPTGEGEFQDPLEQKLAALEQQLSQMQQASVEAQAMQFLEAQEAQVRQAHPDWKDEDLAGVYAFAHQTNGDLLQATKQYEQLLNHVAARFVETKAAAPTATPESAGHAQTPVEPPKMQDTADRVDEILRMEFQGN